MFPIRPHRSTGTMKCASGAAAAVLRARAAQWEVSLEETPESLTMHVWGSEVSLIFEDRDLRIELRAPEKRLIGTLQDSATELFEAEGMAIQWDNVDEGALAPGLALMQVVSVTQRTPGFIRIRVSGPEAGRFAQGSLHFRLLLAAQGRSPVWPRIAANGRTVWPSGADALHRPVYTVADQQEDWVEFDIYRHAGSPTCDWADRARPGDPVGLMGPGGGWCPDASMLWMFGDETALPAIERMLKLAKGQVRAVLRVKPQDMGTLADDPRVSRTDNLMTALEQSDLDADEDRFVWFAGPARAARQARKHLLERGFEKRQFMAAAYWDQDDRPA